jgi:hypothetical protein
VAGAQTQAAPAFSAAAAGAAGSLAAAQAHAAARTAVEAEADEWAAADTAAACIADKTTRPPRPATTPLRNRMRATRLRSLR